MSTNTLSPSVVIDLMIDLRIQVAELERQIDALKPAFFAACAGYNSLQIRHERATIFRKLTPGQWNYSADILEQERQLKQFKQSFQKNHEPAAGREVFWSVRLLTHQT